MPVKSVEAMKVIVTGYRTQADAVAAVFDRLRIPIVFREDARARNNGCIHTEIFERRLLQPKKLGMKRWDMSDDKLATKTSTRIVEMIRKAAKPHDAAVTVLWFSYVGSHRWPEPPHIAELPDWLYEPPADR